MNENLVCGDEESWRARGSLRKFKRAETQDRTWRDWRAE